MKAAMSLPVMTATSVSQALRLHAPIESPCSLPRVETRERKGPALHPSPFGDPEVLSLNITAGCAQRCVFCSVRAAKPADEVIYLYRNNVAQLEEELPHRRPKAVYISPATDPFPPLADVQLETTRVIEVLARHHVDAWLMTRGYIRPAPLDVLASHAERVKVTVGLTTLDRGIQRLLEPLTAPPRLRLRQIAALRQLGIAVQVALEPLLPSLTDTRENLTAILDALADLGVRQVTAGYAFLRQGIRDNLTQALAPFGWAAEVVAAYAGGPTLESAPVAPARYLPKPRRQRGYSMLMALAAERGITARVSGLTNPDFRPAQEPKPRLKQMTLPMF